MIFSKPKERQNKMELVKHNDYYDNKSIIEKGKEEN